MGTYSEGPRTPYLRFLVPKPTLLMLFGTRELKYWVLVQNGFTRTSDEGSMLRVQESTMGMACRVCDKFEAETESSKKYLLRAPDWRKLPNSPGRKRYHQGQCLCRDL